MSNDAYLSIRLPSDLVEQAKDIADLEDRSLSSVVRIALQYYVIQWQEGYNKPYV